MSPARTRAFDAARYLLDEEAVAAYLADALDSGSDQVFQQALETAARARGVAEIANASGLGRESLYKSLAPDASPRFTTVRKVMGALGVTITVTPSRVRRPAKKAKPSGAQKAAAMSPRKQPPKTARGRVSS